MGGTGTAARGNPTSIYEQGGLKFGFFQNLALDQSLSFQTNFAHRIGTKEELPPFPRGRLKVSANLIEVQHA
jgi:hypothetical protein